MNCLLCFALVLGILEPRLGLCSEPVNVNFVVFEDSEPGTVFDLIHTKVGQCLNDKEVKIGQVHRIKVHNESKLETIKLAWTNCTKKVKPDFVFDFTNGFFTSLTTISVLQNESIPVIGTGINKKLAFFKISSQQKTKTKQWKNHFLEISSPEETMSHKIIPALFNLTQGSSAYFINEYCFRHATAVYHSTRKFLVGFDWREGILPQQKINQIFVTRKFPPYIFLFGSGIEISHRLETAVKLNKKLETRAHSWWVIPNDINAQIKLPKGLKQVMVLTPDVKNLEEGATKMRTKNTTELFYLDVICKTIAAAGALKSKDSKTTPVGVTALRSKLKEKLESKNLLGNYVYSDKFNEWYPTVPWKIDLVTVNSTKTFATVTIPKDAFPKFNITDKAVGIGHLPIMFLEATVVVDPPFVIRNETCFAQKKNHEAFPGCYFGYVIDLFQKIVDQLKIRVLLVNEEPYGEFTKNKISGARHSIIEKVDLGIGAFSSKQPAHPNLMEYSTPFYVDVKRNDSYAFPLAVLPGSNLKKWLNHMIAKLKNQRYLEQLTEIWFVEYKRCCTNNVVQTNCTASNH